MPNICRQSKGMPVSTGFNMTMLLETLNFIIRSVVKKTVLFFHKKNNMTILA